ncbi:MAG TPA: ACP phosphodiesterase [Bacteroidia bacterium]|jgi:acyl carrier protein phosphodiesterase|nr:ACP phosphodiesterase [Bacteroidia bacterium]
MNFLAHFYLCGTDEGLLIGNFIADGVKGKKYENYPEHIRNGILMHRAIDHFTDTHGISSKARDLLRKEFNHYSGVVLDVFYDHFLAKNWKEFSDETLADYSQRIYTILGKQYESFPERPRFMFPYMRDHDWLMAYAHVEGVDRVMKGMSRRAKYISGMENSGEALKRNYAEFEKHFREFFPLIIQHTEHFRNSALR